jgi:CTP:molybdopterin cytidylyltransferase MocA
VNSCPFSIVILAAGSSQRLGQAKQLVQLNGQSLLQLTADIASSLPATEIIIVTGAAAAELPSIHEFDLTGHVPARLVHNTNWAEGMGTSIATGVREISVCSKGVMILLCDQWRIEALDLQALAAAWFDDCSRIVACKSGQITGPPVIFPRGCFESLSLLGGDQGAHKVLRAHRQLLRLVQIENAATDLDTPADLVKLQTFQGKG